MCAGKLRPTCQPLVGYESEILEINYAVPVQVRTWPRRHTAYLEGPVVAVDYYGLVTDHPGRAVADTIGHRAAGYHSKRRGGGGCTGVTVQRTAGTALKLNLVCNVKKAIYREITAGQLR